MPASLVREGAAMIGALAADLVRIHRLPRERAARSARTAVGIARLCGCGCDQPLVASRRIRAARG